MANCQKTNAVKIDQALESDPKLFERLKRLKSVDTVLSETLSDFANTPAPDHIVDLIRADQAASQNNVISMDRRRFVIPFQTPLAMAAAAAFGIFVGGQFMQSSPSAAHGSIYAGNVAENSSLFDVLETVPSQAEQAGITPVLTFSSVDGGVCRELVTQNERALACRNNGSWTVLAVTHEPRENNAGTYATASADASIVFDVLSQQLMSGAPLSSKAERTLIDQNWRSNNQPPLADLIGRETQFQELE